MTSTDRGTVLQQLDRLFSEGTLAGLGDCQLLERYLTRRDEAAFEALVEVHGPMVLGLCRRFLRDPRDIEDAFQATFLVLVRKAPGLRDGGLLSNWLYGVALRVAMRARANLLRRRGREQAIGAAEFEAKPESHELLGMGPVLDQELSRLPAKYRAPLVLCYLRGQTHDQAASELRCPVGTVRSRMARGRELLKRRLTRRGYAPSATFFGAGLDVPAHLLAETVPARLVAATVEGAFAIGSSHTLQAGAGAASVLALTQGVLTSMKLAQLKWIGLGLLATGLSAGGAVVVAVSAQTPASNGEQRVTSATFGLSSQEPPAAGSSTATSGTASSGTTSAQTTEDRLNKLEQEIDRLFRSTVIVGPRPGSDPNMPALDRLEAKIRFFAKAVEEPTNAATSTSASSGRPAAGTSTVSTVATSDNVANTGSVSTATSPSRESSGARSTARKGDDRERSEGSSAQIRELEAQLRAAIPRFVRAEQLHKRGALSEDERQTAKDSVDLTVATLNGMNDDLADALEQAKLTVKKKLAELDEAIAGREIKDLERKYTTELVKNKAVSVREVATYDSALRVSQARVRVKEVELEEAQLQARKLERWRGNVQKILDSPMLHPH